MAASVERRSEGGVVLKRLAATVAVLATAGPLWLGAARADDRDRHEMRGHFDRDHRDREHERWARERWERDPRYYPPPVVPVPAPGLNVTIPIHIR